MLIKFASNLDYDFGEPSVEIITDRKQLVKRASTKLALHYQPTKGQTDLHVIALGAYEGTGQNRNGDRFMEADCRSNHHHFVKSGNYNAKTGTYDGRSVHRHHKNKPTDPKYGNIKASAYNEDMKRIELIVGLDDDQCSDILHEQATKGQTAWSMASKQKYDVCSKCGHKAYTDKDRCAHVPRELGEIEKDGEMVGMINPDPHWFEHSYVFRPADRIGFSLSKLANDSLMKQASPRDYLVLYPDFYIPPDNGFVYISKKASEKRKLLTKLSELEKRVEGIAKGFAADSKDKYVAEHAGKMTAGKLSASTIDELRKQDPTKLFKVLAENGITFGPEDFIKYLFSDRVQDKNIEGMKSHLPTVFSDLDTEHEGKDEAVNCEKFEPSESSIIPQEIKALVNGLINNHSLFGDKTQGRVMRITIIGGTSKKLKPAQEKTKEAFDKGLAKAYASYKLAALNYMADEGKLDNDLLLNSVIQNRI